MVLSNTKGIDLVIQDNTGEVGLIITAPDEWDTDTLSQLNDKIATYVSFIKGPQFKKEYGKATAFIEIFATYEPTFEVKDLLKATSEATGIRTSVQMKG